MVRMEGMELSYGADPRKRPVWGEKTPVISSSVWMQNILRPPSQQPIEEGHRGILTRIKELLRIQPARKVDSE